jgi:hypothetical protein
VDVGGVGVKKKESWKEEEELWSNRVHDDDDRWEQNTIQWNRNYLIVINRSFGGD